MKKKEDKVHPGRQTDNAKGQQDADEKGPLSGYPEYPAGEDIYSKFKEEKSINPEDVTSNKGSLERKGTYNEKDFEEDVSGGDLDVPGSELDDIQENIGSEDEENNYYSIGGDDHNELEEDN
jgi:hypothetical protein